MKNRIVVAMVVTCVAGTLAVPVQAREKDDVTIEVRGVPAGAALDVAVSGANGIKTVAMVNGVGSIAGDFMNEPKADVYIDTCKDKVYVKVIAQGGLPPPEEDDCDRKVIAGWLWGRGKTLAIDARQGVIVSGTSDSDFSDGRRTAWTPFVSVDWGGASLSNANTAVETLAGRYQAANYTQSSTSVDRRDTAFNVDAGVRYGFTNRIGIEIGGGYGRWGGASLITTGSRTFGDLRFDLDSSFSTSRWGVGIGVPIGIVPNRFELIPEVGSFWWKMNEIARDYLAAQGQQVRGGTSTRTSDGRDWSYGIKARTLHGRMAFEVGYRRVKLDGAFEPNGSAGWPRKVMQHQVTGGATFFPFGRGR